MSCIGQKQIYVAIPGTPSKHQETVCRLIHSKPCLLGKIFYLEPFTNISYRRCKPATRYTYFFQRLQLFLPRRFRFMNVKEQNECGLKFYKLSIYYLKLLCMEINEDTKYHLQHFILLSTQRDRNKHLI